jgi:RHS repeat-associated protein
MEHISTIYGNTMAQPGFSGDRRDTALNLVVTDASGNVVGENRYYPYGETRFSTGSMYTDKLFTGQREITGLGIYHYQARFYSPKLGRFISPDTIIPVFENPQSWNRFSYAVNNPIRYNDPDGHCAPVCVVPVILVIVGVVAVTAIFYATVPPPALLSDRKLSLLRPDPPLIIPRIYPPKYKGRGSCFESKQNAAICALFLVALFEIGKNLVKCGSHKPCADEPNLPTVPTTIPTVTPTAPPLNTSTPSCPPYIQCPNPPDGTSTSPASTPAPANMPTQPPLSTPTAPVIIPTSSDLWDSPIPI